MGPSAGLSVPISSFTPGTMNLNIRNRSFEPGATCLVMGILNVTPDSFSDGGDHESPGTACERALQMIKEGADIIDVGPESTRPGAAPVSAARQIARAVPVIEAIREVDDKTPISVDIRLASVAKAALDAGADMVNDVSALRDDDGMAEVVAAAGVPVVLMHRRGTSDDMQRGGGPQYDDVVGSITDFFRERRSYAIRRGIKPGQIVLDPGIGFGKRVEHNLMILQHLNRFVALGQPVMVGASRKRFIGDVLAIDQPKRRGHGSLTCATIATMAGAAILRVHDVRATVEMVRMCLSVKYGRPVPSDESAGSKSL